MHDVKDLPDIECFAFGGVTGDDDTPILIGQTPARPLYPRLVKTCKEALVAARAYAGVGVYAFNAGGVGYLVHLSPPSDPAHKLAIRLADTMSLQAWHLGAFKDALRDLKIGA